MRIAGFGSNNAENAMATLLIDPRKVDNVHVNV